MSKHCVNKGGDVGSVGDAVAVDIRALDVSRVVIDAQKDVGEDIPVGGVDGAVAVEVAIYAGADR